jgi:hypothetical protein
MSSDLANIWAYTASGLNCGIFPEYVSLNHSPGARAALTVRGPQGIGGSLGPTTTIQLTRDQLKDLATAIIAYL